MFLLSHKNTRVFWREYPLRILQMDRMKSPCKNHYHYHLFNNNKKRQQREYSAAVLINATHLQNAPIHRLAFFERRSYTLLPFYSFPDILIQPHYSYHSQTFFIRSIFIMDGKKNHPLQSLIDVPEVALIPPYLSLPKVVVSIPSNSFDGTVHRVYCAGRLAAQKT